MKLKQGKKKTAKNLAIIRHKNIKAANPKENYIYCEFTRVNPKYKNTKDSAKKATESKVKQIPF